MAASRLWRRLCRVSLENPERRPTRRAPKVHPTTGLPLSRAKGQHILHNRGVLRKMVEAAGVQSMDSVYEVGCGTGELTMELLRAGREVHTVDIESRMVQETERRAAAEGLAVRLRARAGDALRVPLPQRFDVCVANLPFQISAPFLFLLLRRLSSGPAWRRAVLMVQREFAERLLADPGEQDFSRLALSVRLFAKAERVCDVKPGSFQPQPQVTSTLVRLEPRWPAPDVQAAEWEGLLKLLFSRRRKTLQNQFRRISALSMLEQNYKLRCSLLGQRTATLPFPDLVSSVLEEQGLGQDRAYAMDVGDLYGLLRAFHRKGIYFAEVQSTRSRDGELLLPCREDVDDPTAVLNPVASQKESGQGFPLVRLQRGLGYP